MSPAQQPRHVRVFLSSPGDVAEERHIVRDLLHALPRDPLLKGRITIEVVSWNDPDAPAPMLANLTPQEAVDRGLPRPSECDLVVVLLWARMGTPLTTLRRPDGSQYLSGTEYEFEDALASNRPILLYRRTGAVPADRDDPEQRRLVDRFFDRFRHADGSWAGGYSAYETVERFRERFPKDVKGMLRQLEETEPALSYVEEVRRRGEYLGQRYVPLHSHAMLPTQLRDRQSSESRPPQQFRPKIFRVIDRSASSPAMVVAKEQRFDDVAEAVERCGGSAVILGEPGAGKTTALWHLMLTHAETATQNSAAPLPVLLSLGGYDGRSDVLAFVRRQLAEATNQVADDRYDPLPAHRRLAHELEAKLAYGRLALFFDGLNEMPRECHAPAVERLIAFQAHHLGNRFLFTCREADYLHRFPLPEIHVEPLDDEGIRAFVRRYLDERADRFLDSLSGDKRGLWEMGRNPYMLQLLVSVFEEQGTLPANRAALFGESLLWLFRRERLQQGDDCQVTAIPSNRESRAHLVSQLARRWPALAEWNERPEHFGLNVLDETERTAFLIQLGLASLTLSRLAYRTIATGKHGTTIPLNLANHILSEPLSFDGEPMGVDAARLLRLASNVRLLERKPDAMWFGHELLQEFFAALHLYALGPEHPELAERARFDQWDQVMLLLAGLGDDGASLVERLIPLDPFFAARCCGTRPQGLSQDVANRLVALLARYARDVYGPWRVEAVEALADSRLPSALSVLVDLLEDASLDYRITLGAIGTLGRPEGFDVLNRCLQDEENGVRRLTAARALDVLGGTQVADAILKRLERGDEGLRESGAGRILERHSTRKDIPRFMALLSSDHSTLRWAAVRVLGELGAEQAVPAIVAQLRPPPDYVREAATDALRRLGARTGIPALRDQLTDRNGQLRQSAARALSHLMSAEDKPTLLAWIGDDNPWRRLVAYEAVGRLRIRDAIGALVDRLGREISSFWTEALAGSLIELEAREAVPALINAVRQPTGQLDNALIPVLERLTTPDNVPALVDILRAEPWQPHTADPSPGVRGIVRVLQSAWRPGDAQSLVAYLGDAHPAIRWGATRIARRVAVPEVVPLLAERLRDEELLVRREAVEVLSSLGMHAAVPALIESVRDEDGLVRAGACRALGHLHANEAIHLLLEGLRDDDRVVRESAGKALAALQAPEAVASLIETFPHDDAMAARMTLGILGELQEPRAMCSLLLLAIDERTPAWSTGTPAHTLSSLPHDSVLEFIKPLRGHPDWWIRRFLIPWCEELRRKGGLPREVLERAAPRRRLALRSVAEISKLALDLWPNLEPALRFGPAALRRLGCPAAALDMLDSMSDGRSRDRNDLERQMPSLRVERARCLVDLRRFGDALTLLRGLSGLHPNITVECGRLLEIIGANEEAEESFTRAIQEARPYGFFRHRAAFHIRHGKYEDAQRDLARATELDGLRGSAEHPTDVDRWHPDTERQAGQLALASGQFAEALAAFERAGQREPDGLWEFDVAFALEGLNRRDEALASFERALSRTELHEEAQGALQDLRLLARSHPDAHRIEVLQERIAERTAEFEKLESSMS